MTEEKKDLKPEEQTPEGGGQPENKPALPEEGGEETPKNEEAEELKKQLEEEKALREKAELDRDNYREGMLSAKAGKDSLFGDEPETEPTADQPIQETVESDEEGWKEVEKRAESIAQKTFSAEQKKQVLLNEKVAKKSWLAEHPELLNDGLRLSVLDEFTSKHGTSVEGIKMDLERAYKFYKVENNIEVNVNTKTEEARKAEEALSSTPVGGAVSDGSGFSDEEVSIMKEFDIKPELFEQFRQKVLSGEFEVPQEVINLLKR